MLALLRANAPETHRRYRAAAWHQLRRELRMAPAGERWRSVTDLLHLIDQPVVRAAFFQPAPHRYAAEPARAEDGPAIDAIA